MLRRIGAHLEKGATILGTAEASGYPMRETRIEGETCEYYPALINADHCDGVALRNNVVEAEKVKEVVWRSDVFRISNLVFEGNKVNGKDVE